MTYDGTDIGSIADDVAGDSAEGQGGLGSGADVSAAEPQAEGADAGRAVSPEEVGSIADDGPGEAAGQGQQAEKAAVPEDYSLEVDVKTFPMEEDALADFTKVCKGLNLSRAQAQGVLDWHKAKYAASAQWAGQEQARVKAEWSKSILEDREFGGANYRGTVADARKALREFDPTGALRKLLKESGGEHHPDVIRAIARVGRAMGEHQFVGANGAGKEESKTPLWERMYGKAPAEG